MARSESLQRHAECNSCPNSAQTTLGQDKVVQAKAGHNKYTLQVLPKVWRQL